MDILLKTVAFISSNKTWIWSSVSPSFPFRELVNVHKAAVHNMLHTDIIHMDMVCIVYYVLRFASREHLTCNIMFYI